MTLIKNISGFRGTVGGPPKENLTPFDIVTSTSAFCKFLKEKYNTEELTITTGRDGRATEIGRASCRERVFVHV
jgi:phosphomannomutase